MTKVLRLCYTGAMSFEESEETDVYGALEALGIGAESHFSLVSIQRKKRGDLPKGPTISPIRGEKGSLEPLLLSPTRKKGPTGPESPDTPTTPESTSEPCSLPP